MSNTICKFSARMVRGNSKFLAYTMTTSGTDVNMEPELKGKGRSMLAQAQECVNVNNGMAAAFSGSAPVESGEITDAKSAASELVKSADNLAGVLENMDDSMLDQKFVLPFGTLTGQNALTISLNHMPYHTGQMAYIELLDGDPEFRFPPGFVE